ncbi:hypothetical protein ABZ357_09600 [Streptomyces sp. NPDC005917]|uniref:hypothetical protein n=1 Tax=unclassified Streptomyces TaxID=2593676 RepID=UPI0033DA6D5C
MSRNTPAEQAPTRVVGALPAAITEPSDLAVAVRVAQQMLSRYGAVDHRDVLALNEAYGAIRESLKIMLRAVDAEPEIADTGKITRCPAAHPDDPTGCNGPIVVTVLDANNAGANGYEHHAATLLASLDGGRVYALPDAPTGAAIRTLTAAGRTHPYAWVPRGEDR